jgi:prophage maintenance system killer protein
MASEDGKGQGTGNGAVAVYQDEGGGVRLEVRLEGDTVWLSLAQMAELFGRDKSVISRHLTRVFATGELGREAVVAENATTAADGKTYQVDYYNLDAILSVGYRVNSRRGTQFRIWATTTLREHLLRGYTLNERRLRDKGVEEMQETLSLPARTLKRNMLVTDEGRAVLEVVEQYARSWQLLLEYDERRLPESPRRPVPPSGTLSLESARRAIVSLRETVGSSGTRAAGLFGHERDDQLEAILGNVEQTFGGVPLYPSAQARAAHLLYFLIKDHPFTDGNKRIGTLLFLEYLRRNGLLLQADGTLRLADTTVVALALLVAESEPRQKDLMIRLVLSLIEDRG